MTCISGVPSEVKARRIIQCPGDDPIRVNVIGAVEFDHTILCEMDNNGDLTGVKVAVVISYSGTGVPTTAYFGLSTGEEYELPEGYSLSSCGGEGSATDLEMKEMCDSYTANGQIVNVTFIRWFVTENDVPTGVHYDTDLNGQPYTVSLVDPIPGVTEFDSITIEDDLGATVTIMTSNMVETGFGDYTFDDGDGTTGSVYPTYREMSFSTVNGTNYPNITQGPDYAITNYFLNGVALPQVPRTPVAGTCESIGVTYAPLIAQFTGDTEYTYADLPVGITTRIHSLTITVISGTVTVTGIGSAVLPEGSSFTWTAGNADGYFSEALQFIAFNGDSANANYTVHIDARDNTILF